jgi:4-hydroxythreonine-4-phosphate dehydrogenase
MYWKRCGSQVPAAFDTRFDAVVTAPVQKSVINNAGVAFSGHTEFFQEQAGVARVVMMLACPGLRVALSHHPSAPA